MSVRNVVVTAAALLLVIADNAFAQAQRTFVASNGSDSHPCSLAQPCRSFATAIAKVTSGGEVIVLDSAGYGTVTITKSVSLIAPPGAYAGVSVSSGDGIAINGAGIHVVLRGLAINGLGGSSTDGIEFIQGAELTVEECEISGMGANGIEVAAGSAIVRNTVLRENGAAGFYAVGSGVIATLSGVHSERNGVGARANFGASITIVGSVLTRNTIGVHVLSSSSSWSKLTLVHSVLNGVPTAPKNSFGVFLDTTPGSFSTAVLDGDNIFDFGYAVWFSKGGNDTVFSRQNNTMHTGGPGHKRLVHAHASVLSRDRLGTRCIQENADFELVARLTSAFPSGRLPAMIIPSTSSSVTSAVR